MYWPVPEYAQSSQVKLFISPKAWVIDRTLHLQIGSCIYFVNEYFTIKYWIYDHENWSVLESEGQ